MNEHDDVVCQVRDSFSGLHMDLPVEDVLARGRVRQRRRVAGLTGAGAAVGAAVDVTLTLGVPAQTRPGNPPPASPGTAKLAAFSVTSGPGNSTTLMLRKTRQYRLDPGALREALARHGIPALVTVGTFCSSTPRWTPAPGSIVHSAQRANGWAMTVINRSEMPSGTRLSIGLLPSRTPMGLIENGAHFTCRSTPPHPPAAPGPRMSGTKREQAAGRLARKN
jgi:hypothetical protein